MSEMFLDEDWNIGTVVDLRNLEETNCFCGRPEELSGHLADIPLDAIHLIDSGDYHYLTLFFLQRIQVPFQLLLIDNHPDDQPTAFAPDTLSCGGWVRTAKETLSNLKSVSWNRKPEPGLPVYVSIDIDFLNRKEARTDWTQGEADFARLAALLPDRDILGIDICGGISAAKGGLPEDFSINRLTRTRLIQTV